MNRTARVRAICPTCGKVLTVPTEGSPVAGLFGQHRPVGARSGPWCDSSAAKVRKRDQVHDCWRCRELPTLAERLAGPQPFSVDAPVRPDVPRPIAGKVGHREVCATHLREHLAGVEVVHPCIDCRLLPVAWPGAYDEPGHRVGVHSRPPEPRPIKGKRRCDSHLREHNERLRRKRSSARRLATHGVDDDLMAQAIEAQGGGCACGNAFAPKYTPRTDHNHRVAREECDHDEKHACPHCFRGGLHDQCNVIIGRMSSDQLRRLADYKDSGGTMAIIRARVTGP